MTSSYLIADYLIAYLIIYKQCNTCKHAKQQDRRKRQLEVYHHVYRFFARRVHESGRARPLDCIGTRKSASSSVIVNCFARHIKA